MNVVRNVLSEFNYDPAESWQKSVLKVTGSALLASVCAYGGTYFFTIHQPLIGATYFGMVTLISQIAYSVLEKIKENVEEPLIKHVITVIQLLQIPFFFHLLHGGVDQCLSATVKMEIIAATAYFAAIPIFFHLGIQAWNEPTEANIAAAMGLLLPLAAGLRSYAELFKT